MPVIKSAKKKLRQDKKRKGQNDTIRVLLQRFVKQAMKSPSEKTVKDATRIVDKAAKKNIIHKNKASRIKSTLAKLLGKKRVKKEKKAPSKPRTTKKQPNPT